MADPLFFPPLLGATIDKAIQVLTEQVACTPNICLLAFPSLKICLLAAGFLYEFLLCYKVFITGPELLLRLTQKLNSPDKDANVQRLRIVNFLKIWIKEYPPDWSPTEQLYKQLMKVRCCLLAS